LSQKHSSGREINIAAPVASSVQAAVITNNINAPIPSNIDGIYLNFVSGATGSSGGAVAGWDINMYLTNNVFTFFLPNAAGGQSGGVSTGPGTNIYADLAIGTVVGAASPYTVNSGAGGAGSTVNFQTTGLHILGFRFLNEATSMVNYGYALIENTGPSGFPATLRSYSYENSGGAITVVPEPSTYALLGTFALGALGLRQWRQRKAA
jgi:hypothetical protein